MTTIIPRYNPRRVIVVILNFLSYLLLMSPRVMSESMFEVIAVGERYGDFATPTQRLIERLNEIDEHHIMKEKVISELKRLLMPGGYGALDFRSDDVVARLYLIATVHPKIIGDVLSYHRSSVSQTYLECLQTIESRIRLNLNFMEAARELEKGLAQISRVQRLQLQRLLFVSSLQQHARQGVEWKETYYGKIESKLAVQRQELEKTFESTRGADFESPLATVIILNWPAWSSALTCGKIDPSLEPSAPQPEQTFWFTRRRRV
jgi:hypothetical protein